MNRNRVIHREPVAEGFSVETGVLSSTQNVQVNFRPRGWYRRDEWFGRNRDSALGMWSLSVPEMIGTSDGFVFGFDVSDRWQPAGGGVDALQYTAESCPLGPDFDRACFAKPSLRHSSLRSHSAGRSDPPSTVPVRALPRDQGELRERPNSGS